MNIKRSHFTRSYWGEFDAKPLIDWLNNAKARPKGDPVEKLLRLNAGLPFPTTPREIAEYVGALVRATKLAVAPVLAEAARDRWRVEWRLVGKMVPAQGLAVVKLLHLADRGLLGRVRRCDRRECSRWFYARFRHQRFCSSVCQVRTFREDPEWKARRAEDMRRLRALVREKELGEDLARKSRRGGRRR
jgi:hypothetical protein